MRFVAQYADFGVGIRPTKTSLTRDGETIVREEGIEAEFRRGRFNQHDLEIALLSFQFRGQYQNEDQATLAEPTYRLSIFDTDEEQERQGWDDETRVFVEQRLMSAKSYGRAFTLVPEVAIAPPWPLYDAFEGDADEIVLTAHTIIGVPFEEVLRYEESKWGKRREDVIEALHTAIEVRDKDRVVVGG